MIDETREQSADQAEPSRWKSYAKFCLAFALLTLAMLLTALSTHADAVPPKPIIARADAAKQTVYKSFLPMTNISLPAVSQKKGLAWTYQYCEDAQAVRAKWVYDWGMNPKICNAALESIPMIRDASQWAQTKQVGGNSQWILGFNEPDLCPDQACLTPAQAVPLWREIEAQFPNKKLVAPVPSQAHLNWLIEFRNAYIAAYRTPPRFNALAAHWYGFSYNDAKAVINWYKARATEFGVAEIWITEFAFPVPDNRACFGVTQADAMNDAQKLIAELDNDAMVTRYAWFAPRVDTSDPLLTGGQSECHAPLLDFSGNTLTSWGMMYRAR
ncbi:MAG: hypothetical protein HY868_16095 [Chloroflexi bacterium]|nr:hypothetical protein [Chloroflexota bacterium]